MLSFPLPSLIVDSDGKCRRKWCTLVLEILFANPVEIEVFHKPIKGCAASLWHRSCINDMIRK